MTQPKEIDQPWLLDTLIGCSRLVGGSGRPTVTKIRAFTDQWISGHFGHIVSGSHARQAQGLIEDDPAQSNVSALVLGHCDRVLPPGRRRRTANSGKNQGFHGSMESLPFWSRPPRYTCKAILRPDPKMTQRKAVYHPWLSSALIGHSRLVGGLGSAYTGKNQGFHYPTDSRRFRLYGPRFACKADIFQDYPTLR
jgi:hypothetical protein